MAVLHSGWFVAVTLGLQVGVGLCYIGVGVWLLHWGWCAAVTLGLAFGCIT